MSHPCIEYMKRKHILREKTYPVSRYEYNLHDSLVTASSSVLHKPPFEQKQLHWRAASLLYRNILSDCQNVFLTKCKMCFDFRSNFPNAFFQQCDTPCLFAGALLPIQKHSLSGRLTSVYKREPEKTGFKQNLVRDV